VSSLGGTKGKIVVGTIEEWEKSGYLAQKATSQKLMTCLKTPGSMSGRRGNLTGGIRKAHARLYL